MRLTRRTQLKKSNPYKEVKIDAIKGLVTEISKNLQISISNTMLNKFIQNKKKRII